MKKLIKTCSLLSAILLGSISGHTGTDLTILPEGGEKLFANTAAGQVTLNLTRIGLYNGQPGTLLADSNIEYGMTLSLDVGANLPKTEMTSTTKDVAFLAWCFYKDGGMLTYTDVVVENISLYQAVFTYTGTDLGGGGGGNTSNEPPEGAVRRIYFYDQAWWNNAEAATAIYAWSSTNDSLKNAAWPGVKMTHVEYKSSTKQNLWYYDFDTSLYDKFILVRVSSDGKSDWGAQTKDLSLDPSKNTMTLDAKSDNFGSNNTVTWSTEEH